MLSVPGGRWEGLDGLGDDLLAELLPRARTAVHRGASFLSGEIKRTLTGSRHGRTYRVSRTGKLHTASAPGEPPAVLFGNLRNSVGFTEPLWDGAATVWSEVGPGLGQAPGLAADPSRTYARRMEWGGVDSRGVYIAPRPYMETTVIRVQARLDRLLEEEMDRAA